MLRRDRIILSEISPNETIFRLVPFFSLIEGLGLDKDSGRHFLVANSRLAVSTWK